MNLAVESGEIAGCSAQRLSRSRPVMQRYVEHHGFAGISTVLARRGRVIHFEQVGWRDRESRAPLASASIFRVYSMTKPIICTAFMTLYEEGAFQLFDPLARFIPAFAKPRVLLGKTPSDAREVDAARPITILDLSRHTAGLTHDFLEDSPVSEMYRRARTRASPFLLEA